MTDCPCLVAITESELRERFGPPRARRPAGGSVWLVYSLPTFQLRVRCDPEPPHAVHSWTATFSERCGTLREAATALGLWPQAAPDQKAATSAGPLIRRAVECRDVGRAVSLTASIAGDRISHLSVFDEPPEWS